MKKRIELYMAVALLLAAGILSRKGAVLVQNLKAEERKSCVVIDAGHGGDDPGKIGVNGALEKDINLIIAGKVKSRLEKEGIKVVLTRDSDKSLHDAGSDNQKVSDMRNRCALIDKTNPIFTVSIHQNSYTEEYVKGPQCFYYEQSPDGEMVAGMIQESLIAHLNPESKRDAKANSSYYLLKKTAVPTVIVECGFLSNWEEAAHLTSEEYQNKVAEAVTEGILQSLEHLQGK